MSALRQLPLELARWLLLFALAFAPWAYGCTRVWATDCLTSGLWIISGLAAAGFLARGRRPRTSFLALALILALAAQGWGMTFNAGRIFDPETFVFYELVKPVSFLPGAVDLETCRRMMYLVTGLFGVFIVASDMAGNPRWRKRIWTTLCLIGFSIVVLGLWQRATGADAIFWQEAPEPQGSFFATYRYHGNAGSFINLVIPFAFGALIAAFLFPAAAPFRFPFCLVALTLAAAAFVNSSRAAMTITLLLLGGMGLFGFHCLKRKRAPSGQALALAVPLTVGCVALLAWAFGLDWSIRKWSPGLESLVVNDRFTVAKLLVERALPVSGWYGFGPGTFQITFPLFTNDLGDRLTGIWRHAHQDYLETMLEWGYIGAALWGALVFAGPLRAAAALWRTRENGVDPRRVFLACCLFALAGILHAAVDFPLQIASLQLYTATILGLTWGMAETASRADKRKSIKLVRRLLRFLGHQSYLRFGLRDRIIRRFHDPDLAVAEEFTVDFYGMRYPGNFDTFLDWSVFYYGAYCAEELRLIADLLEAKEDPVFLDVGANVGHHTLFASRLCRRVYAFEPYARVSGKMAEKIDLNNRVNVEIVRVGLGLEDAEVDFSPPETTNTGTGHFHVVPSDSAKMKLPVRKGDRFIDERQIARIDFIKIDVEGYEIQVLEGLAATLRRDRPVVFLEWTQNTWTKEFFFANGKLFFPGGYQFYQFIPDTNVCGVFRQKTYRLRPLSEIWGDGNILALPD